MGLIRFFHSSSFYQNVNKSALALLRKKTGYSFANIRKALELHNNDAVQAENWLKEQAKALGWTAADKLQARKATQGLVGLAFDKKKIAMVEINCETDFVARNEKFKSLVELVAKTCLQQPVLNSGQDTNKVDFSSEELGKLKPDNDSLADHLALLIGSMGEKMMIKRGFCYETVRDDVSVAVAVHPPADNSTILLGKYASFISFLINPKELESGQEILKSGEVANKICKHIIGLNPTKIGDYIEEEQAEPVESTKPTEATESTEPTESTDGEVPPPEVEQPNELVNQEFLFDNSMTVGKFLKESGVTILDFKRFQCGEDLQTSSDLGEKNDEDVKVAMG